MFGLLLFIIGVIFVGLSGFHFIEGHPKIERWCLCICAGYCIVGIILLFISIILSCTLDKEKTVLEEYYIVSVAEEEFFYVNIDEDVTYSFFYVEDEGNYNSYNTYKQKSLSSSDDVVLVYEFDESDEVVPKAERYIYERKFPNKIMEILFSYEPLARNSKQVYYDIYVPEGTIVTNYMLE